MADSISKDIEIAQKLIERMSRRGNISLNSEDRRVIGEALESWLEILNVADSTSDEVDD